MKITHEKMEIDSLTSISWEDVETIRLLNDKLAVVLSDGRVVELKSLSLTTVDLVFRTYENYLKNHPEKRKKTL